MTAVRLVAMVGPRAAGKTTLGRALATALAWDFADADDALAAAAGMSAADCLRSRGEAAFRVLEERVVLPLLACRRTVVALGGGAVLSAAVRARLVAEDCHTVLVLAPAAVLVARLRAGGDRPPLLDLPLEQEVAALLAARGPLYREVARTTVDTDTAPATELAARLAATVRARSGA
jgi:shikimate kinase